MRKSKSAAKEAFPLLGRQTISMIDQDMPAEAMLEADELLHIWATSSEYTLHCGPNTDREAAILRARYPGRIGAIELGVYMRPGTMAVSKEQAISEGLLPPHILLG